MDHGGVFGVHKFSGSAASDISVTGNVYFQHDGRQIQHGSRQAASSFNFDRRFDIDAVQKALIEVTGSANSN
jgi:hypothetical protein